jgi:hypothetical protein
MQTRLGWITLALLCGSAVLAILPNRHEELLGTLLRISGITGLTWLAWPDLKVLNPWVTGFVIFSIIIVARWPRLLPAILVAYLAIYFLRPKRRSVR